VNLALTNLADKYIEWAPWSNPLGNCSLRCGVYGIRLEVTSLRGLWCTLALFLLSVCGFWQAGQASELKFRFTFCQQDAAVWLMPSFLSFRVFGLKTLPSLNWQIAIVFFRSLTLKFEVCILRHLAMLVLGISLPSEWCFHRDYFFVSYNLSGEVPLFQQRIFSNLIYRNVSGCCHLKLAQAALKKASFLSVMVLRFIWVVKLVTKLKVRALSPSCSIKLGRHRRLEVVLRRTIVIYLVYWTI
jgi:hypothetical protein